mgnify:CR=1 FL=1
MQSSVQIAALRANRLLGVENIWAGEPRDHAVRKTTDDGRQLELMGCSFTRPIREWMLDRSIAGMPGYKRTALDQYR